MGVSSSDY